MNIGSMDIEMVFIPGGEFLMGGELYCDEKPVHRVKLSPYFIGKYPVMQGQWREVMGTEPSRFRGDDLPVESVSWDGAKEFCARLSRKTGRKYRLPTEAEWEMACRAGTTTQFAFGDTITPEIVNYDGNYPCGGADKGEYRAKTVAVGSLGRANAWGLFDMHGNVWEWCEDDWHEDYNGAPVDGCAWVDLPSRGSYRVIRGGGWFSVAVYCRSAFRNGGAPGARGDILGFRLARDGAE